MQYRTLEEYKEEVFDSLDEKTKLEWLYEMSEKLCNIEEYINNLKPLTEEETGIKEMLKLAYKEDNIKNLETSFKTICHLEDFEIAIWNIKDILEKVSDDNE